MQDTGRNSNKDSNMDNDMNNNANNNVNEQPPSDDKRLREMYDKLVGYEKTIHEQNPKNGKNRIRCIYIIPLFFLVLLMIVPDSSKIIFLVLWIVSLFAIAVYLIGVEYVDYKLQEKMNEISGSDAQNMSVSPVVQIEDRVQQIAERVEQKFDTMQQKYRGGCRAMKKIFQIYLADLKRISTNVVAIVIIMGLGIIPALYAWFNIMSNWDPYGEEATSQMHIAVYSEDEGMSVGDLKLCMGDSVIKGLKENDAIGWIFTDSSKEALEYVYSGKCYAAFIVPKEFFS